MSCVSHSYMQSTVCISMYVRTYISCTYYTCVRSLPLTSYKITKVSLFIEFIPLMDKNPLICTSILVNEPKSANGAVLLQSQLHIVHMRTVDNTREQTVSAMHFYMKIICEWKQFGLPLIQFNSHLRRKETEFYPCLYDTDY